MPTAPVDTPAVWRFADFELHNGRALLRRGQVVPLGRRALFLLCALVAAQGRLVTRQELIESVWPRAVVVENALHQHLRLLRLALGDNASLVQTVGRQGYRFAGVAERVAEAAPEPAAQAQAVAMPPAPLTPLIGREAECKALRQLLQQHRCVTLLGAGGVGKTRLALAAAHDAHHEGTAVVWVELAALQDDDSVAAAITAAMGLQGLPDHASLQWVRQALHRELALLVLDNCEHLHKGCAAAVSELLRDVPTLAVLATSQCPLGVPGERRWRVQPLKVPAVDCVDPALLRDSASVQLLAARVADAQGKPVVLTGSALADAVALCQRLDGNPLALELAAVRVASLGWAATRAGLAHHFDLLHGARHGGAPQQQSLQALLDWSHGLLPPPLRALWRRLSVFRGGFTLRAASAVVGEGDADTWLAGLAELVDRSLVQADTDSEADESRYRMLEVPRAFAHRQLGQHGEQGAIALRHALHMAAHFEEAAARWDRTSDKAWLAAHALERDNLSAAIAFALAQGDRPLACRLLGASIPLWRTQGALHELRRLVEHPALQAPVSDATAFEAQLALARAISLLGESSVNEQLLQAGTEAAHRCGQGKDRLATAQAWLCVASACARSGDSGAHEQALDRAQSLLNDHRHGKTYAWLCDSRAWQLQLCSGDLEGALGWAQAAQVACRDGGAALGEIQALLHIADLQLALGDAAAAITTGEALVLQLQGLPHHELRGRALANLGAACSAAGQTARARQYLLQALDELHGQDFSYWVFDHLAPLALADGHAELAARMVGYADAGYARHREGRRVQNEAASHRNTLARLRGCLTPQTLAALLTTGAHDHEGDLVASFGQAVHPDPLRTASASGG